MTLIKFIFVVFTAFAPSFTSAQCLKKNQVAVDGEEALFLVYYKLGFLWMEAAEVTFSTKMVQLSNKPVFHFKSMGKTLPGYDWLFTVRDTFESITDTATLKPVWFQRNTHEGNYSVSNQQRFDYQNKKIIVDFKSNKTPPEKDTLPLNGCIYDVLTAIYYCRNIPFQTLLFNELVPVNMIIDNDIYPLYLRYLGVETVENHDLKKYRCQKFSVLLVEGTIFSGGEDMTVWVTDDRARVPIKVEANIIIGSIIANIHSFKGTKWPVTSQIASPK